MHGIEITWMHTCVFARWCGYHVKVKGVVGFDQQLHLLHTLERSGTLCGVVGLETNREGVVGSASISNFVIHAMAQVCRSKHGLPDAGEVRVLRHGDAFRVSGSV